MAKTNRHIERNRRHIRVRKSVAGTLDRPRLAVFRSHQHIYAQVIDDAQGMTLAAASTVEKELKGILGKTSNKVAAVAVGELIAKRAIEKGINKVVYDRGGFRYHGRIASVADGARKAGLEF